MASCRWPASSRQPGRYEAAFRVHSIDRTPEHPGLVGVRSRTTVEMHRRHVDGHFRPIVIDPPDVRRKVFLRKGKVIARVGFVDHEAKEIDERLTAGTEPKRCFAAVSRPERLGNDSSDFEVTEHKALHGVLAAPAYSCSTASRASLRRRSPYETASSPFFRPDMWLIRSGLLTQLPNLDRVASHAMWPRPL